MDVSDNVMFPFLLGLVFLVGTIAIAGSMVFDGYYGSAIYVSVIWGGGAAFFFREAKIESDREGGNDADK